MAIGKMEMYIMTVGSQYQTFVRLGDMGDILM